MEVGPHCEFTNPPWGSTGAPAGILWGPQGGDQLKVWALP